MDNIVSVTAYRARTDMATSSSFMVEHYVTSVLTEDVLTETMMVTGGYESPTTLIAIVAVVAVAIVVALMKRKPKPKQTQLEKYA